MNKDNNNYYNDDNPLNFNTDPNPYWENATAKVYYRKEGSDFLYTRRPDNLKQIYEQRELEKAELEAETSECWKLVKQCFQFLRDTLDEYPSDVEEIRKTAKFCVKWMDNRLKEKKFKRLSKFDIDRIWETEWKSVRREYGFLRRRRIRRNGK